MELISYTMTASDLQNLGNDSITMFIDTLVKDDVMPAEKGEELKAAYAIVVYRKGYFGRFLDKLWNTGDKDTSMKIVRFSAASFEPPAARPKLQLVQNENTPS